MEMTLLLSELWLDPWPRPGDLEAREKREGQHGPYKVLKGPYKALKGPYKAFENMEKTWAKRGKHVEKVFQRTSYPWK